MPENGRIVYVVHRCVTPRILKSYGKGTLWRCHTCAKDWRIIFLFGKPEWRTSEYCQAMETYRAHEGWRKKPARPIWDDEKQRMYLIARL